MEHYVTLFDNLFLPQGLALHMSMERHVKDYVLWILCVDDEVFINLSKISLHNVRLLQLSALETKELLQVKPSRSKGEYCWTLTPFAPRFVFEADSTVYRVTYIDADMWFRKHPRVIFQEFEESGKAVLITDHAYAPEYDQSATSGQFCVQFMTFCRNSGECVRQWWEERCIEWCFAKYEDGKFGDQKYLDDWPERFSEHVHVLKQQELLLAPWNMTRFPFGLSILYHFQGLRIISYDCVVLVNGYPIPKVLLDNVYKVYLDDLRMAISIMQACGVVLTQQMNSHDYGNIFSSYLRGLFNNFWRFNLRVKVKF